VLRSWLPRGEYLFAAYVLAGLISMLSVAVFPGNDGKAYVEAMNESWLALVVLAAVSDETSRGRAALTGPHWPSG